MNEKFINKIILGDALKILPQIEDNAVDLILTDPPYFLDKMDNNWNHQTVSTITDYCHVVKSLPPGMKSENVKRVIQNIKTRWVLFLIFKPQTLS